MIASIADRDVVEVSGPDASSYLQGQISQDVDRIGVDESAWSLILAPTGKLTAWFRLHRVAHDRFYIDLETGWAVPLVERLERFKLRTAVDFSILEGWRMLSLRTENTAPVTEPEVNEPTQGPPVEAALTATFRWPGFAGTDHLDAGLDIPGGIDIDDRAFEEARIRAAVPKLGADIGENTIPAEGGANLIEQSVSFTKGCYTGQELVARIDSRGGNVPRPLRLLIAEGTLEAGAAVTFDGRESGVVTSAAANAGLAALMRKVEPGSVVSVDGIKATVQAPS
ncbi:MAG: hypothetical protein OXN44_13455 [Acidimicrobiaceae bacterium]|nr:hypothetical protein [Acidimicrobiaceae bacterium]